MNVLHFLTLDSPSLLSMQIDVGLMYKECIGLSGIQCLSILTSSLRHSVISLISNDGKPSCLCEEFILLKFISGLNNDTFLSTVIYAFIPSKHSILYYNVAFDGSNMNGSFFLITGTCQPPFSTS